MKHTPGPWHAVRQSEDWIAVVHDKSIGCGFIDVWGHVNPNYDLEANARLVAAAPELFEVLRYWMPFIDSEQDDERQAPWVEKARAILAKIEGGSVVKCLARQHSDQMICHQCGLVWDVNDPEPPVCGRRVDIFAAVRDFGVSTKQASESFRRAGEILKGAKR